MVANALFRRYALTTTHTTKLLGFEHLKELYATDSDFSSIYAAYEHGAFNKFYRHECNILKTWNIQFAPTFDMFYCIIGTRVIINET